MKGSDDDPEWIKIQQAHSDELTKRVAKVEKGLEETGLNCIAFLKRHFKYHFLCREEVRGAGGSLMQTASPLRQLYKRMSVFKKKKKDKGKQASPEHAVTKLGNKFY